MTTPRVSVIIVSYNGRDLLQKCLDSVIDCTTAVSFEIIVVDNGSTDGSPAMVEERYPHVTLIVNQENCGFAAANNQGLKVALGDLVLLLNPDTVLLNDAISLSAKCVEAAQDTGLAGCRLLLPDGSTQRSVRSFPTLWDVAAEACFLYLLFSGSRRLGKYHMRYFDYAKEEEVGWVSGAFLMIRRSVIERIGFLDERFFMYSEEMDYCLRASRAGFRTLYTPAAVVHHFWGGANAVNRRVVLWTHGSQLLYIRKHFRGFERTAATVFKIIGVALRVPAYFIAGIVSGDRILVRKSAYHAVVLPRLFSPVWKLTPAGNRDPWPM